MKALQHNRVLHSAAVRHRAVSAQIADMALKKGTAFSSRDQSNPIQRSDLNIQRKPGQDEELPLQRMPMNSQNRTLQAFLPKPSVKGYPNKSTETKFLLSRKRQNQALPSKNLLTPEDRQQLEDDIVAVVTSNGLLGLTPGDVKKQWGLVQQALTKGKPSDYYGNDITTRIDKLSSVERKKIAGDVFSTLLADYKNAGNKEINYKNEYDSLSRRIKGNMEGGPAGFITMRDAFFAKFGSIISANYYYQTLVDIDSPWSQLRGAQGTLVHPEMAASLNRAADLLKGKGLHTTSLTAIGVNGIGGFNIRENRNNTKSLSEHSFGFAVDIDADTNPNAKSKDFPAKFVQSLTGTDIYDKQEMKHLAPGSDFDEALKSVIKLRSASDLLKVDFADESFLGSALVDYIHGQQQSMGVGPQNPVSWANQYSGAVLINLLKEKQDMNLKVCIASAGFTAKDQTTVISFLKAAYALFLKTFKKDKNGSVSRVPSSSEGSQASIAVHGFISIPSEVIAALVSKQGGGLKWLGYVSSGAKDFMHFELSPKPKITVYGDFPENSNKNVQVA